MTLPDSSPAPALTRITTRYVAAEDRLRLAGELAGGSQLTIWLTRRLLQRLVPKLLTPLSGTPGATAHHELLLGFAQQRAVAAQLPVAPVDPHAEGESWLAQRAAIARGPQALTLTFEAADGRAASLALPEAALHQWLAIVCRACIGAEWPLDIWPAWITDNLAPEEAPPPRALH